MQYEYSVRKLDALGRLPLPIKICRELRIDGKGNKCEIFIDGQTVILQKWTDNKCVFCKGSRELEIFKNKYICKTCKQSILEREVNSPF